MERFQTGRLETLADGVFAIVMTLLVLDLRLPEAIGPSAPGDLSRTLLGMWPNYASYVVSFVFLSLWWLTHHALFGRIKRLDGPLIWLNLLYLMLVALIPFSASLAAGHWGEPITGVIYGLNLLFPLLVNRAIFSHAARTPGVCDCEVSPDYVRGEKRATAILGIILAVAIGLSFVHAAISFALYGAMAVFYVVSSWRGREGLSVSSGTPGTLSD